MSEKRTDFIERVTGYLSDSTGRDKFSKLVQYTAKLTAWYLLTQNPKDETGLRFKGLSGAVSEARKLPRLLKSLNELQTISKLVSSNNATSLPSMLKIVGRVGWANYWLFDNLIFLNKAKFTQVKSIDVAYYSYAGWTVGLVCEVLLKLNDLYANVSRVDSLQRDLRDAVDDKESESIKRSLRQLANARVRLLFEIFNNVCDLTSALNGMKITQFSEGVVSVAGVLSAVISGYYRWIAMFPN